MTIESLNTACTKGNINNIKIILNDKVIPTSETFDSILIYASQNKYYLDAKWKYYSEKKEQIRSTINEMINLIRFFGYVVTKKNIIDTIQYNIEIKNIPNEYFNDEEFKKNLSQTCNKFSTFLYGSKINITGLYEIIKKTSIFKTSDIKKIIKDNNIKVDSECLKLGCMYKRDASFIKYLIEEKKVDINFDHLLLHPKLPSSLKIIVNELKKKYDNSDKKIIKKN